MLPYPEPEQKVTCAGPKILQSKFTLSVGVTPKVNRKFSMQIYLSFVFCLALDSFPRWTGHVWGLLKQANISSLSHHHPVRTSSLHTQTTCPCHTLFTTTKAALTHLSWLNSFAYEKLKFGKRQIFWMAKQVLWIAEWRIHFHFATNKWLVTLNEAHADICRMKWKEWYALHKYYYWCILSAIP